MCYTVENVETKFDKLKALYHKYSVNTAKISEEDLNGKYKRAFDALKGKLLKETLEYAFRNCLLIYIPPTEKGTEMCKQARDLVQTDEEKLYKSLLNCTEDSYKELEEEIMTLRKKFLNEQYFPNIQYINEYLDENIAQ